MAIKERTAPNHRDRADSCWCCNTLLHRGKAVKTRVTGLKIKSHQQPMRYRGTPSLHRAPAEHEGPRSPVSSKLWSLQCSGKGSNPSRSLSLPFITRMQTTLQRRHGMTACRQPHWSHSYRNESLRCLRSTNTRSIALHTWIPVALINCWKPLQSFKGTSHPLGPQD